jgi:hypothetical protein
MGHVSPDLHDPLGSAASETSGSAVSGTNGSAVSEISSNAASECLQQMRLPACTWTWTWAFRKCGFSPFQTCGQPQKCGSRAEVRSPRTSGSAVSENSRSAASEIPLPPVIIRDGFVLKNKKRGFRKIRAMAEGKLGRWEEAGAPLPSPVLSSCTPRCTC